MPIYEFRCLKCNECFELLVINRNDPVQMCCPKCNSEEFERVLSVSNHSISGGSGGQGPQAQTRSCPSGSCTTLDLPGPSR